MNKSIKIRKVVEGDYQAINSLYLIIDNLYYEKLPNTFKKPQRSTLPRGNFLNMIEEKDSLIVAAEVDKKVIGFIYATLHREDGNEWVNPVKRADVEVISVASEFSLNDIGVRLFAEVEKWGRKNKADTLTALVYNFDKPTLNFYHKKGFETVSTVVEKRLKWPHTNYDKER